MIPKIKVLGDRAYQLTETYRIVWEHEDEWHKLTIPEGFVCDGNSVPWFGRLFVPGDWTLGMEAVLAHDFIYARQGRLLPGEYMVEDRRSVGIWYDPLHIGEGFRRAWKRRDADRLFAKLMRESGVPRWRRRMAYRAVRFAFWNGWDEYPWSDTDNAHD